MKTPAELLNFDSHLDNISLPEWKTLRLLKKVKKRDYPLYCYELNRNLQGATALIAIPYKIQITESKLVMMGIMKQISRDEVFKGIRIN